MRVGRRTGLRSGASRTSYRYGDRVLPKRWSARRAHQRFPVQCWRTVPPVPPDRSGAAEAQNSCRGRLSRTRAPFLDFGVAQPEPERNRASRQRVPGPLPRQSGPANFATALPAPHQKQGTLGQLARSAVAKSSRRSNPTAGPLGASLLGGADLKHDRLRCCLRSANKKGAVRETLHFRGCGQSAIALKAASQNGKRKAGWHAGRSCTPTLASAPSGLVSRAGGENLRPVVLAMSEGSVPPPNC